MPDIFYFYSPRYLGVADFAKKVCVIAAPENYDTRIRNSHLLNWDGVTQTSGYWEFDVRSSQGYGMLIDQRHGRALVADIRHAENGVLHHISPFEVFRDFKDNRLAELSLMWRVEKVGETPDGDLVTIISAGDRVLVPGNEEDFIHHQNRHLISDWTKAQWVRKRVPDAIPAGAAQQLEENVYYNIRAAYAPSAPGRGDLECYLTVADDNYRYYDLGANVPLVAQIVLGNNPTVGNAQFRIEPTGQPDGTYRLISRNSGWSISAVEGNGALVQSTRGLREGWIEKNSFLLRPCGGGLFKLWNKGYSGAIKPAGVGGVFPYSRMETAREHEPGTYFYMIPAQRFSPPQTPGMLVTKYRDEPEDYTRMILGGLASIAGGKASEKLGVPGGATVCAAAFNFLWPKPSTYQILQSFREDILADVNRMIQQAMVEQGHSHLNTAREHYLVNYLTSRATDIDLPANLAALRASALSHAEQFNTALSFLLPLKIDEGAIESTPANLELVRAGFPLYVVGSAEYINALQEWALMCAYTASHVPPDIVLKAHNGKYLTAENGGGGRVMATGEAVPVAQRLGLKKPLSVVRVQPGPLTSGDAVFLRAPNFQNVSAVEGGGREVIATAPHVSEWETFIIEKLEGRGEIRSGDAVSFRSHNGRYLKAIDGGGREIRADAPHRAGWETFTVEINAVPVGADDDYEKCITSIATTAELILRRIDRMYHLLLNDRLSKVKAHFVAQELTFPWFRVVDTLLGKTLMDVGDSKYSAQEPWGYATTDIAYKNHLAYNFYFFQYRYMNAAERLQTIAAETRKMCEEMRDQQHGPARNRDFRFQAQRFFQRYASATSTSA